MCTKRFSQHLRHRSIIPRLKLHTTNRRFGKRGKNFSQTSNRMREAGDIATQCRYLTYLYNQFFIINITRKLDNKLLDVRIIEYFTIVALRKPWKDCTKLTSTGLSHNTIEFTQCFRCYRLERRTPSYGILSIENAKLHPGPHPFSNFLTGRIILRVVWQKRSVYLVPRLAHLRMSSLFSFRINQRVTTIVKHFQYLLLFRRDIATIISDQPLSNNTTNRALRGQRL